MFILLMHTPRAVIIIIIHTCLVKDIPWSRRWLTQGEAQPLHSGCADPCALLWFNFFFVNFPSEGLIKTYLILQFVHWKKKVEGVLQTRCKYSDKHLALKHIIQNHIHPSLVQNESNADNNQLSFKACIKIFIPNLSVITPITTFLSLTPHWHSFRHLSPISSNNFYLGIISGLEGK